MMGYRDKTFCPFWRECSKADDCSRPLTDEVLAAAKAWWGDKKGEPPIIQFVESPDCFEPDWTEKEAEDGQTLGS